jgi:hypothetical protein
MLRYKTLVALTIAVATPALAAPQAEFGEADGVRFKYTTELHKGGVIHFAGVVLGSGDRFVLDVDRYGHVDGVFGENPVQYDVDKKVRDRVAAMLGEGVAVADATPQK